MANISYYLQELYKSEDNGATWVKVPNAYKIGTVAEDSSNCQSEETYQEKWVLEDINGLIYDCDESSHTQYQVMVKYYSYDGANWYQKTPIEMVRSGRTIENSVKCGWSSSGCTDYTITTYHQDGSITEIVSASTTNIFNGDTTNIPVYSGTSGQEIVLQELELGDCYETVNDGACYKSTTLIKVVMGNNIGEIEKNAFAYCKNITDVILDDNINTIGSCAFYNCYGISDITLPSSLKQIETDAFDDCHFARYNLINNSNLSSADNNYWLATMYDYETDNHILLNGAVAEFYRKKDERFYYEYLIEHLENYFDISIESPVKIVKSGVFNQYPQYTRNLTIGNSVEYIVRGTFGYSDDYKEEFAHVILPDNLKVFCLEAFQNCLIDEIEYKGITYTFSSSSEYNNDYLSTSINGKPLLEAMNNNGVFLLCNNVPCEYLPLKTGGDVTLTLSDGTTEIHTYDDGVVTNMEFRGRTDIVSAYFGEGIVKIDYRAFLNCTNLTSVTLSDTVLYIQEYAFANCSSLKTINTLQNVIEYEKRAFSGCETLEFENLIFSDRCLTIGESAFSGCINIKGITLSQFFKRFSDNVFYGCSALTSVTVNNVKYISDENCPIEGKNSAFNQSGLDNGYDYDYCVKLTMGDGTIQIDTYSGGTIPTSQYAGNSQIEEVYIGNKITTISEKSFDLCPNLKNVYIGENVTFIGKWAFGTNTSLDNVVIPANVTEIQEGAFLNCKNLNSLTFAKDKIIDFQNEKLLTLGHFAFAGTKVVNVELPETIRNVGNSIFDYCYDLKSVNFPIGGYIIPQGYCYQCSGLTSIVLPPSVQEIRLDAFNGCTSLTSVIYKENTYTSKSKLTAVLNDNGVPVDSTAFINTGLSD